MDSCFACAELTACLQHTCLRNLCGKELMVFLIFFYINQRARARALFNEQSAHLCFRGFAFVVAVISATTVPGIVYCISAPVVCHFLFLGCPSDSSTGTFSCNVLSLVFF